LTPPTGSTPDDRAGPGAIPDILAVIESAKARGGAEALQRFISRSLPDSEAREVEDAAEVALEVIESIPVFLARARQEGEARGLSSVVSPLLDHAERYYLDPIDVIPEMTQGLPGLLDDSYLVLRLLQHLDNGPRTFLDWDLEHPTRFVRRLIGPAPAERLDRIVGDAVRDLSTQLAELWSRMAHPA
jgi:hypothetical protein